MTGARFCEIVLIAPRHDTPRGKGALVKMREDLLRFIEAALGRKAKKRSI